MNTQEREQLSQFLQQLVEVKLTEKNNEAENLISQAVTRQPDALYLLVQRCLIQDQALRAAQAQIANLQNQLQQQRPASSASSFLNNDPWAAPANANSVPGASAYRMPTASAGGSPNFAQAAPQNPGAGSGSSFLGNIATTAAGVVAGSFLFQGIENLMGHHQAASGWGQQAFGGQIPEQTIINNYYGDDDQMANNDNGSDDMASDDNDSFFDDGNSDSDWA